MFVLTKENSPIGKVLWYDGELYHYHTVNNETYPVFIQVLSVLKYVLNSVHVAHYSVIYTNVS